MQKKLSEIIEFLIEEGLLEDYILEKDVVISGFSPIQESKPGTLSWMRSQQFDFSTLKSAAVICSQELTIPENCTTIFIPVEKPRLSFTKILTHFASKPKPIGISTTACISKNAQIAKKVFIGEHVVIGNDVSIGQGSVIHSNVSIYDNVKIGDNCIIHSGSVIGADGFGFEKDEKGNLMKVPHIGGVIIKDNVEIGANTCIDRGTLSNTVIGNNVKIDNLCHIAHNVQIHENSTIIALSMIAGSVKIGKNCWIAPCAAIKEKLVVNDGSLVGLGAVAIRDVRSGDVVVGVPAKSIKK